ncbi:MAG TPA: ABC transporter permease, partial [Vicinamibacterales bacterium]
MFSLANSVLLRTMPVHDPSALFEMKWRSGPVSPYDSAEGSGSETSEGLSSTSFSYDAYRSFQSGASRLVDVLGFADLGRINLLIDNHAELGTAHGVSGNYFAVLVVDSAQGRLLTPADDKPDARGAAVISDALWHRRFGGGAVLGRTVVINSVPFTIVGTLPAAFHGTDQVGTNPDVYVPLSLKARVMPNDDPPFDPNFWWVLTMARLRPGVSAEQARSALDVLLKRTVTA